MGTKNAWRKKAHSYRQLECVTPPALFLLQSNTRITGTMLTNKEVLLHFMNEDLNKGSFIFIRNRDMLLVRFSGKKNVHVLTPVTRLHYVKRKDSLLEVSRTSIISLIILKGIIKLSISANTTQSLEKKAIEKTPCLH